MSLCKPWTVTVLALFASLAPPATAQVHILQTSCDTSTPNPVVHFSIVSGPATPSAVCRMGIVPASAECFPLSCGTPESWECFPGDVTTFFRADTEPRDCVAPGQTLAGFRIGLFGNQCCFSVHFFGAEGSVFLGEQEICFECHTIGTEQRTWGQTKRLFE